MLGFPVRGSKSQRQVAGMYVVSDLEGASSASALYIEVLCGRNGGVNLKVSHRYTVLDTVNAACRRRFAFLSASKPVYEGASNQVPVGRLQSCLLAWRSIRDKKSHVL